jgi:hypothetical protein
VPWTGFALLADHPEAAAGQQGEGVGVVGRSWHRTRIRAAPRPTTLRTDRILTMDLAATAMRTGVSAGRWRPWTAK